MKKAVPPPWHLAALLLLACAGFPAALTLCQRWPAGVAVKGTQLTKVLQ